MKVKLSKKVQDVFRRSSVFHHSMKSVEEEVKQKPIEEGEPAKNWWNNLEERVKQIGVNDEEEDEEQEEAEIEQNFRQVNFKKLLKKEKVKGFQEFPFTGVQVEDAVFINSNREMVSLECIFYMTDCHYKQLEKRDQHQKVDRIGSENYKLTKDGDIGLANFEQDPTSLQANKFEPYLSKKVMNIAVKAPAWGGLVKEI